MARILIVLLLVAVSYSFTYQQIFECEFNCNVNLKNEGCLFSPEESNEYPKNPTCAQDITKLGLCLGYYGCLMPEGDPDKTVMLSLIVGIPTRLLGVHYREQKR